MLMVMGEIRYSRQNAACVHIMLSFDVCFPFLYSLGQILLDNCLVLALV